MLAFAIASLPRADAAPYSPTYATAAESFTSAPIDLRIELQLLLTAAGYWNAVPNASFSKRLFEALLRFQSDNGFPPTGVMDVSQVKRLASLAAPNFQMWGFRKVAHPFRNHTIWIPFGLGLIATQDPNGVEYKDSNGHVDVVFKSFPNSAVAASFYAIVQGLESARFTIHYKVLKDGWFVISATTPDGVDTYMRYHQDGTFVTGFSVEWNNSKGDVHGDRMATLMSASLWADMTGAPFFDLNSVAPASSSSDSGSPPASQPAAAESSPSPPPAPATFSTGTGFFVDSNGAFVTAEHVVNGCTDIAVRKADGTIFQARILGLDKTNDLALLRAATVSPKFASVRTGVRLGEGIEVFGFPHSDILASSGNFTIGNITALSGMGDDSRFLQLSAPVQAGNSGGPLLDQSANVVGVVDAKLDALKVAGADGDLPQNVNFAVKADLMQTFLQANSVSPPMGTLSDKPMAPADIADKAKAISVFIACK